MKSLILSMAYVLLPGVSLWWFLNSSAPQQHINRLDSKEVQQLQHYDENVQAEMAAVWKRIEDQLQKHGWDDEVRLNPPATREEIAALESTLGYRLAADYKASLLIHNGSEGDFCSNHQLYSIERILWHWKFQIGEWGIWRQFGIRPEPEKVASYSWHPGWVAVGGWDVYNVIVNIETGGVCSRDESDARHESASWKTWLETVASRLESGELQPSSWGLSDFATPGSDEKQRW